MCLRGSFCPENDGDLTGLLWWNCRVFTAESRPVIWINTGIFFLSSGVLYPLSQAGLQPALEFSLNMSCFFGGMPDFCRENRLLTVIFALLIIRLPVTNQTPVSVSQGRPNGRSQSR